jgi:hypothetical protein
MTAKEILNKVRSLFAEPIPPAAPAIPAEPGEPIDTPTGVDCPLQDGRIMHCDPDMNVGAKCTIDGQPTPAGDYVMQDGSVMTVDENSTVANVAAPSPMTTDVPTEPTFEERLKLLEDAIAKLSAPVLPTGLATEVQLKAAEKRIEKQDEVIKGLFELAEKLAETPTAEPKTLTGTKKDQFEKRLAKEQKLEEIGNAITQLKNKK